jgi:hypothetical protein
VLGVLAFVAMSADQARQYKADVKARGGVRGQEWILDYGDG